MQKLLNVVAINLLFSSACAYSLLYIVGFLQDISTFEAMFSKICMYILFNIFNVLSLGRRNVVIVEPEKKLN